MCYNTANKYILCPCCSHTCVHGIFFGRGDLSVRIYLWQQYSFLYCLLMLMFYFYNVTCLHIISMSQHMPASFKRTSDFNLLPSFPMITHYNSFSCNESLCYRDADGCQNRTLWFHWMLFYNKALINRCLDTRTRKGHCWNSSIREDFIK